MPTQAEIDHQRNLLDTYRRSLAYHIEQLAQLGVIAPFSLVENIRTARTEIRRIKEILSNWNVPVEDKPDDDESIATPQPPTSEQMSAGLVAMVDLLREPSVRGAVEGFRESFEILWRQIDRLATYKDLHDLLHDLQFNCYAPILRGAHDFPNNELFLESLSEYESELRQVVNSLWEIVGHATLSASEQFWIQQIDEAAKLLQSALEQSNKELLDRTTFQLGRALYIYPARINERLKETARDLPLHSLIKAMATVREQPPQADQASGKITQLIQGIDALSQIEQTLAQLIDEHDTWQEIDLELNRVEENLEQHLQELSWLWPDLKTRVAGLCEGRSDRWTQDLRQAEEKLNRTLTAYDRTTTVVAFRGYRRQISLCFFQADKKLKQLCRTLRQIDGPLNTVTSVMV
jgi:hypothetical protein